jgi:hypothetical protein
MEHDWPVVWGHRWPAVWVWGGRHSKRETRAGNHDAARLREDSRSPLLWGLWTVPGITRFDEVTAMRALFHMQREGAQSDTDDPPMAALHEAAGAYWRQPALLCMCPTSTGSRRLLTTSPLLPPAYVLSYW